MYELVLVASTLLFATTAFAYGRSRSANLAHPATLYLSFHGFVFVFRPIIAHANGFDFVYRLYDFMPSEAEKITVILGTNLAMLVFVGTTWLMNPFAPNPDGGSEMAGWRARSRKPLFLAAAAIAPFAIAAQLSNWGQRASQFDAMMRDGATGTLVNTTNIGWFSDLGLALAPLAVLLVWVTRYRWAGWLPFGIFAILQAGTGVRGPLVYAIVAISLLYALETGRRWPHWRVVASLVVAVVAFNQLVIDRGSAVRHLFVQESQSQYVSFRELQPLEDMDFANLEYFEYIVHAVPKRTGGWDYFANNLQIFTEPVPRALWPRKPVGSPVQFFSLWDHGRPVGITLSLPGVGWLSWGYAGIIVQTLLFAAIFGALYRRLVLRAPGGGGQVTYALVAATSIIVFRDGALISFLRVLPFYVGPWLLVLALLRMAQPRTETEPAGTNGSTTTQLTPAERRRQYAGRAP